MNAVMRVEVYPRGDGRFAWRAIAHNGQVIASDASQGYEHESEAMEMARQVVIEENDLAEVVVR